MKTILVTGCSGFLGFHLSHFFLNQGYNVIGVDNFCTGLRSNALDLRALGQKHFQLIEFDITKDWTFTSSIPSAWLSSLTYVFHFASPASPIHYQNLPLETLWANTVGLANCIQFADTNNNARVIFASSSEVYGDPQISPQPESYWGNVNSFGARSCYDEAKRFGEALIHSHNLKMNTRHGLIRIFNTYGPRMNPNDGRVVINFILQALNGQSLTIYGTGLQTRSFCYVDDLVSGVAEYAFSNLTSPLNLGNDHEFTVLELAKLILDLTGSRSKITYHNLPIDDPKHRRPDLTLARKNLLNWKPTISLETGIKKMIESLS